MVLISSPTMPAEVRADLEARIVAGEAIGAPEIRAARGPSEVRTATAPGRSAGAAHGGINPLSLSQVSEGTGKTKDMIGKK